MSTSFFSLRDKVAIVTGAGQGIGKGIALKLAEAGTDVVVAEIDVAKGEQSALEVRAVGRRAVMVPTDVCDSGQIDRMVARSMEEFDRIDILVNNVGGIPGKAGPLIDTSEEDWNRGIDLNLKSVFLCCKAVGKVMRQQKKGNIINISSHTGIGPYTTIPYYGIAKAAVIQLTSSLAAELAPYGIRVNGIAPGPIMTPLLEELFRAQPERKEELLRGRAIQRLGRPEDVAMTALFLASDAADWITGEVIRVTGGRTGA